MTGALDQLMHFQHPGRLVRAVQSLLTVNDDNEKKRTSVALTTN